MLKPILSTLFLMIGFSDTLYAGNPLANPQSVREQIDQLLHEQPENLNIGISAIDGKTQKIIYQKNSERSFIPASTQKLFTAYAAYNYLKPAFHYQTFLFADLQNVNQGILNDNLYFKFSGDPLFSLTQLDELISKLSQHGIKTIQGKIVVDDSAFNQITMSPGTTWDDQFYCFGSPISALIINHNCVSATLSPSPMIGGAPLLTLPEYPQQMTFKSMVKTSLNNQDPCKLNIIAKDENTYLIKGCVKNIDSNLPITMAIRNPQQQVKVLITYLLTKYGIQFKDNFEFGAINHPVKVLGITRSPTLPAMLTMMLKDSDNTIANSLFKTIGSLTTRRAGSWTNGRIAIQTILKQSAQMSFPKKTFFDGSGQSRYNYLTPKQLTNLLVHIYNQPYAKQFITALPISGLDGTLKDRFKSSELAGKIFAKTGSESGVLALAGYMRTQGKRTVIFAIMINGFTDSPAKFKVLEEKILEILYRTNDAPVTLKRPLKTVNHHV